MSLNIGVSPGRKPTPRMHGCNVLELASYVEKRIKEILKKDGQIAFAARTMP